METSCSCALRLQYFQTYFTRDQLLSVMLCSSSAGSALDILNVTIKEACKILVFPLAYRCADVTLAPSSKSCNVSFGEEEKKKTSNTPTSYHHVSTSGKKKIKADLLWLFIIFLQPLLVCVLVMYTSH